MIESGHHIAKIPLPYNGILGRPTLAKFMAASHYAYDTSPTYLLFQTLLPLFWTITCMIWMKLTRTDVVFIRTTMMLFYVQKRKVLGMTLNSTEHLMKNNKNPLQRWRPGGPHPVHEGGGAPPRACPPTLWPPWRPPDSNSNSIYLHSGRKK